MYVTNWYESVANENDTKKLKMQNDKNMALNLNLRNYG